MKKAILLLSLLSLAAWAAPLTGNVTAVSDDRVLTDLNGVPAGLSAIVIYPYEGGETIVRECTATGNGGELICRPFEQFDQNSVPGLKLPVRVGDRVIAGPLFKTALIIAPTAGRYVRILDRHRGYRFVHPDLFAAQLEKASNPNPKTDDFKTFCRTWMAGTVIFGLEDGDWVVDCQSFTALEFHADTPAPETVMKPFFHRLDTIERGFFAWGTPKEIGDFNTHYRSLIQKEFHAQR